MFRIRRRSLWEGRQSTIVAVSVHRWTIHPMVDGCREDTSPEPPL